MTRVSFRYWLALSLILFVFCPSLASAAEKFTPTSQTESEKFLSQSLDTPLTTGQEQSDPDINADLDNSSSGTSMTWFFIKVVVVLAIILGGIWLLSKILEKSGMAGTGNEIMGVRSTLSIGQNQYLQIVQVGPRYFMLGVTENSVTKLDEITDSDTIEALQLNESDNQDGQQPRGFAEIFSNFVGSKNHDFKEESTSEYLDDLTDRVNQLKDEAGHHEEASSSTLLFIYRCHRHVARFSSVSRRVPDSQPPGRGRGSRRPG
ncbi:MAG: flagellar biosynthetic protein FliO [bacterium]